MDYNSHLRSGTIVIDSRDTVIKISAPRQVKKSIPTRCAISEFSAKSRNRLLYKARNMGNLNGFNTLTYHHNWHDLTGELCKLHWSLLRKRLLRKHPNIFGLWFFEFQQRGAPHFHFITSQAIDEDWLKLSWNEIVDPENTIHLEHGANAQVLRKKHAAGSYAAKYSAKNEQKQVPDDFESVGRFWGIFGTLQIVESEIKITGNKEFFDLVRTLRKAHRKHLENLPPKPDGTKYKWRRHGHGIVGFTAWDCSGIANQYLKATYELLDNPQKLTLLWYPKHTDSCLRHKSLQQL